LFSNVREGGGRKRARERKPSPDLLSLFHPFIVCRF